MLVLCFHVSPFDEHYSMTILYSKDFLCQNREIHIKYFPRIISTEVYNEYAMLPNSMVLI